MSELRYAPSTVRPASPGRPPGAVVTADLLADVFDVEATVEETDHGQRITPLQPLDDRDV